METADLPADTKATNASLNTIAINEEHWSSYLSQAFGTEYPVDSYRLTHLPHPAASTRSCTVMGILPSSGSRSRKNLV
jgi:hypothetical protein